MLIFPVVFVLFFCGKYRVMIARNYLFITPFLVLFTARGVTEVIQRLRQRWLRWLLAGALTVALGAQAIWLVTAAESIRHFDLPTYARQAVAYASSHPGARFRFSERVRALIADQQLALPPNVGDGPGPDMVVFLARADGPGPWRMKTNDPWLTKAVFGPREVNFNWYTTWDSRDRVVVMTTERARASEIRLALTK
jgi:hypothetical protein